MSLVGDVDLPDVAARALAARKAGNKYITVEIEPVGPLIRYVNLWEGCYGEIVGRSVDSVRARVDCVGVANAYRRRLARDGSKADAARE
ncbi:MAG TPA: hypothetical protein VGF86_09665 [Candidatus Tumulicola sp.]|jgi:hypothetical protein